MARQASRVRFNTSERISTSDTKRYKLRKPDYLDDKKLSKKLRHEDGSKLSSKVKRNIKYKFKESLKNDSDSDDLSEKMGGSLKNAGVDLGVISLEKIQQKKKISKLPTQPSQSKKGLDLSLARKQTFNQAHESLKVDSDSEDFSENSSAKIYNLTLDEARESKDLSKKLYQKSYSKSYSAKDRYTDKISFERKTNFSAKVTDISSVDKRQTQKKALQKKYGQTFREVATAKEQTVTQSTTTAPRKLARQAKRTLKEIFLGFIKVIKSVASSAYAYLGGGVLAIVLFIIALLLMGLMFIIIGVGSNGYSMTSVQATEVNQSFTQREMDYLKMLKDKANESDNPTVSYDPVGHEPHELLALVNVMVLDKAEKAGEDVNDDMIEEVLDEIFEARYQFGESTRELEDGGTVTTLTSTTSSFDTLIYGSSSMGMSVELSDFIEKIGPLASRIAQENDIYASVMIAQALLESGGDQLSELASPPYFNLFGIKGSYNGNTVNMSTNEDDGSGNMYTINDGFRDYDSYDESLQDYADLLSTSTYSGAWKSNTSSYQDATNALTGTYATDTAYASKLNKIIEQYDLTQFDDYSPSDQVEENIVLESAETIESTEVSGDKPVKPLATMPEISSPYGYRTHPITGEYKFHYGTDYPAQTGTPLLAIKDGVIAEAGFNESAGNYIFLKMNDGLYAGYYHLNSIDVEMGQEVKAGGTIGTVGDTGASDGAHLHLEISDRVWAPSTAGTNYNPAEYLEGALSVDSSAQGNRLNLSNELIELYKNTKKTRGLMGAYESPIEDYDWGNHIDTNWGLVWNEDKLKAEESDVFTIQVPEGRNVLNQITGRVTRVGRGLRGKFVEVKSKDTITVQYIGVEDIVVSRGDSLVKGDKIAVTGDNNLHLKMKDSKENKVIDPQIMLYTESPTAVMYHALGQPTQSDSESSNHKLNNKMAGKAYDDVDVQKLFDTGKQYIGMPYAWGGASPETSFDCSGFVYWVYKEAGLAPSNWSRTTANNMYYNYTAPVSKSEAKAGDLVFFEGTYASNDRFTHIGIYAGDGIMLHAGDPIGFASIETDYWQQYKPTFGRVIN